MPPLGKVRTKRGLDFGLRWEKVQVLPTAEYWLYHIVVTKANGADRTFTIFVRRDAFPVEAEADAFLVTAPLDDVKGQLEHADEEGIPLFWPNFGGDWIVY